MNTKSNPFNSPLIGILLSNGDATVSVDIYSKNEECEFHRLELTESMFDVFPSGVLIVRDKADFISRLDSYGAIYIKFLYENGDSNTFRIHSVSNLNNAASATEESYIAVHFSNYLYFFCQENTLSSIMQLPKPKVYRIDKFFQTLASKIGPLYTQGMDVNDPTDNYVCYRPLNPKLDGTEVASDNIAEYLNYLTNYAVPLQKITATSTDTGTVSSGTREMRSASAYSRTATPTAVKPRYVFWTTWGSYMNFKYISSVVDDIDGISAMNTYNLKYAIYSGDVPQQKINNAVYKKIYNYSTNQGTQFITKQYYYVRKTPKILDDIGGNTYQNLAYQFLDEGLKYNVQLIGNTGGTNSFGSGSEELEYSGVWGYVDDGKSSGKNSVSTHISNQYGVDAQYSSFNHAGLTGTFQFIDNSEMWKNMFDLTPLDPYYPQKGVNSTEDATNSNLQKVLDIRFNAAKKQVTQGNTQLDLIRNVELQNFVMYSLCCMGQIKEDESFFAVLTSYKINPYSSSLATSNWLYGWQRLDFAPRNYTGNPNQVYNEGDVFSMATWKPNPNVKGSQGTYPGGGTDNSTLAINLNEVGNTGAVSGDQFVFGPGWDAAPTGFKYRPIGFRTGTQDLTQGTIRHIVKMYKKSWKDIFSTAGVTLSEWHSSYDGKYLYYFTAENIVDGACP